MVMIYIYICWMYVCMYVCFLYTKTHLEKTKSMLCLIFCCWLLFKKIHSENYRFLFYFFVLFFWVYVFWLLEKDRFVSK
ncbi:hypothetical protein DFH28DRAFT_984089 [Melampsora americana]|nr:hypothetical protein DFH28DRAFT_984089 [Melampsora americana]